MTKKMEVLVHHVSYSDVVLGVHEPSTGKTRYGQCRGALEEIAAGLMRVIRTSESSERQPVYQCRLIKEADLKSFRDGDDGPTINVGFDLSPVQALIRNESWHNPEKVLRQSDEYEDNKAERSPEEVPAISPESQPPPSPSAAQPLFNRVCFPIFALALHTFLEKMRRQLHRCDYLKVFFLSGCHQQLGHGAESRSTYSAALLLVKWTEQFLQERVREANHNVKVEIEVIHSGSGIFVYDENVRFVTQEVLPKIDAAREKCLDSYKSGWSRFFRVTTTLAEGAPARVSAITQGLHHFRPDYIHILRPKAFLHHQVLFSDGVDFVNFEAASTLPAISLQASNFSSCLQDADIRRLIKEMLEHKESVLHALRTGVELPQFWLRKSRQPVLAVLMVRKPDETPRFYRGMNLEVSMPTGSLCAERNVIGTAIAQDPSLRRADIKIVAVLSLTMEDQDADTQIKPERARLIATKSVDKESAVRETVAGFKHELADTGFGRPHPSTPPISRSTLLDNPFDGGFDPTGPRAIPAFNLNVANIPDSPQPSKGKRALSPTSSEHGDGRKRHPRDLNPMDPCGACNEWLKKIAEWNPSFTVMTFASMSCQEIFFKRVI